MRHNINVHSCCLESLSHNDFADYETEKSPDQRDIHAYLLYLPSDFVDFAFGPGISPCWRGWWWASTSLLDKSRGCSCNWYVLRYWKVLNYYLSLVHPSFFCPLLIKPIHETSWLLGHPVRKWFRFFTLSSKKSLAKIMIWNHQIVQFLGPLWNRTKHFTILNPC